MASAADNPSSSSSDSSHNKIIEAHYNAEDQELINELRVRLIETLNASPIIQPTPDFKSRLDDNIKGLHWRDVYQQYRHTTSVTISTPDPRNDPNYKAPSLVADYWKDYDLYRYLVARKMDVTAAHKQLINTLAWRQAYGVDDLAAQPGRKTYDTIRWLPHDLHSVYIIIMISTTHNIYISIFPVSSPYLCVVYV